MREHARRWGAVYVIAGLFVASWIGQAIAQADDIAALGWAEFWAATLENWQSEFLQLAVQAVFLMGMKGVWFRVQGGPDEALRAAVVRIESKVDRIGDRSA